MEPVPCMAGDVRTSRSPGQEGGRRVPPIGGTGARAEDLGGERDSWFGVEVRHLIALAAVAREASFRGAADKLGYVPSAVSQQVAGLERLIGTRLVDRVRGSKEVALTAAGELLLSHAEEIIERLNAARADLSAHLASGGDAATLRLGICQLSVSPGLLADLLRGLAAAAPGLRVHPVEARDGDALAELLEAGGVDIALGDLALDPARVDSQTVLTDPCSLLVRSDSPWASRRPPETAAELGLLPLIALEGWRFLSIVRAWLAAAGVEPTFVAAAGNGATIRALVASGAGAAIVPSLVADSSNGGGLARDEISVIGLGRVFPLRHVALQWQAARRRHPALDAVLEVGLEISRMRASIAERSGIAAPSHQG